MKAIVLLKVVVEMLFDTSRAMARSDLLGYAGNVKDDDDYVVENKYLAQQRKVKATNEMRSKKDDIDCKKHVTDCLSFGL